jgi:hypothetical protein
MRGIQTFLFGTVTFFMLDSIIPDFRVTVEADKSIFVGGISLAITYVVYKSMYMYYYLE